MALELKSRGIVRVRPLEGGYAEWKRLGYPLVPWKDAPAEAAGAAVPA
ncbi:MAG TPA: hypothetical protein VK454_02800 [Myxococcaceae bacterium]|nr:hypothetical protein [Myxococcaceae bacterium]